MWLVDASFALLITAEVYLRRAQRLDKELQQMLKAGDVSREPRRVLRFFARGEYRDVQDREVLHVFRKSLLLGDEKDAIGPQAFATVHKEHNLVKMADFFAFQQHSLAALCKRAKSELALSDDCDTDVDADANGHLAEQPVAERHVKSAGVQVGTSQQARVDTGPALGRRRYVRRCSRCE